ncbi:MAG: hypothetical protein V7641_5023 [Blastocatellia bacterium]
MNKPHYDLTLPDSLVTEVQHKERQSRLDKFQRRAANPKASKYLKHAERLRLIDFLLALKADNAVIDCMMACLHLHTSIVNRKRLDRALVILKGEEPEAAPQQRPEPDPLPEPDQKAVADFIAKLSKQNDPFADDWSDEDGCYAFGVCGGKPEFGIAEDDIMHLKYKTPEPGDLIVLPSTNKRFYIGYFVAGHGELISMQTRGGLRRFQTENPPLVVTKIKKDDE